MAGLDAHPNIEIRIFNPYVHRSGLHRLGELLTSFTRVNRRMHNKQFIADAAAVVLGGRNIGDEYFSLGELDFQDVDVLAGGPVARQSLQSFEAYWTSRFAVPISQLGKFTPDETQFATARKELDQRCEELRDSTYARALAGSDLAKDLRAHALHLHWAEGRIIADPPGKISGAALAAAAGPEDVIKALGIAVSYAGTVSKPATASAPSAAAPASLGAKADCTAGDFPLRRLGGERATACIHSEAAAEDARREPVVAGV